MKITVKQLAELALESEISDPIDWGYLSIKEEDAYLLMASNVKSMIEGIPENQRLEICMASLTKMLVENFVLNLKLEGQ